LKRLVILAGVLALSGVVASLSAYRAPEHASVKIADPALCGVAQLWSDPYRNAECHVPPVLCSAQNLACNEAALIWRNDAARSAHIDL
jgi:hypothetical protein